jgi:class 3 adenylate cyclase
LGLPENAILKVRIGIHTGPVVAGIVGQTKFAYDIWGDTVNIAARMEQRSEPGKINISAATYELVKNDFNCIYRGELEAKNKGKLGMYFVEGVYS